jgi:hypothetical protein
MNAKERVLQAFSHREPDRVPIDYLGTPSIDQALKRHFSIVEEEPPPTPLHCRRLLFDFVEPASGGHDILTLYPI